MSNEQPVGMVSLIRAAATRAGNSGLSTAARQVVTVDGSKVTGTGNGIAGWAVRTVADQVTRTLTDEAVRNLNVRDMVSSLTIEEDSSLLMQMLDVRRAFTMEPSEQDALNSLIDRVASESNSQLQRRQQAERVMDILENGTDGDFEFSDMVNEAFRAKDEADAAEMAENPPPTEPNDPRGNSFFDDVARTLGDVSNALFGSPRRSSDGARTSREEHEYRYCMSPRVSFGGPAAGQSDSNVPFGDFSYVQAAINVIISSLVRGTNNGPNSISISEQSLDTISNGKVGSIGDLSERATDFSYGNWVDSPCMRRLISGIKRLVRLARSANAKEIVRLTTGQDQSQFIATLVSNIGVQNFAQAAIEYIRVSSDIRAPNSRQEKESIRATLDVTSELVIVRDNESNVIQDTRANIFG